MNDPDLRRQLRTTIDAAAVPVSATEAKLRAHDAGFPRVRRPLPGLWTHRLSAVVVAAVILAVFFVPLPRVSLFGRFTTSGKPAISSHGVTVPPKLAPGLDQVGGTAFPTATHWVVLVDQCFPCEARSGTHRKWVAVTDDAGRSWTLRRTSVPVDVAVSPSSPELMFANARDGWTSNGWVTHDGGLRWAKAAAPVTVDDLVVAGSKVWAIGEGHGVGATRVLTGSVSGSVLSLSAAQPFSGYDPGVLVAPTSGTVYVQAETPSGTQIEVTRDGGRHWLAVTPPCGPRTNTQVRVPATSLSAFSSEHLFLVCAAKTLKPAREHFFTSVSTDGGRTWARSQTSTSYPVGLEAVSPTTAWATDGAGDILRTTDAGTSWQVVWSSRSPHRPSGTLEGLRATGPATAFATFGIRTSKGTYFFVRETTDHGASWRAVSAFTL